MGTYKRTVYRKIFVIRVASLGSHQLGLTLHRFSLAIEAARASHERAQELAVLMLADEITEWLGTKHLIGML